MKAKNWSLDLAVLIRLVLCMNFLLSSSCKIAMKVTILLFPFFLQTT